MRVYTCKMKILRGLSCLLFNQKWTKHQRKFERSRETRKKSQKKEIKLKEEIIRAKKHSISSSSDNSTPSTSSAIGNSTPSTSSSTSYSTHSSGQNLLTYDVGAYAALAKGTCTLDHRSSQISNKE